MQQEKKKEDKPTEKNANADYNPTARDFQRTEEDVDSISQSEEEEKKRTERGNTQPDKNKMS